MFRARRPPLRGRSPWPARVAGDKGYSYPGVRTWLWRHHIEDVIPTRKDQPRDERFDKVTYRRRNIVERVVGWYKECRALGTRYDNLAVNYVARLCHETPGHSHLWGETGRKMGIDPANGADFGPSFPPERVS